MHAEEHIRYLPEPASVDFRIVTLAAVASLLLVALAIGSLYAIYQRSVPIKDPPPPQTFSQPRVTTSQAEIAERERLASEQRQRLDTWRWANPEHTLAQIPIDRAMQLLAQRGNDGWAALLPTEPALSSPVAGAQNATTPPASVTESQPKPGPKP